MRTAESLTPAEEEALRTIYQRDVKYWSWQSWIGLYRNFGEGQMGLIWVLLPYKPTDPMPAVRKRMNELYFEALEGQAAEYGLAIRVDEVKQKLLLVAPPDSSVPS